MINYLEEECGETSCGYQAIEQQIYPERLLCDEHLSDAWMSSHADDANDERRINEPANL